MIAVHPLLEGLPDEKKGKLVSEDQPGFMEPMLATLTDRRFSDGDWIFERNSMANGALSFGKGDQSG
jgi:hypothetical protein